MVILYLSLSNFLSVYPCLIQLWIPGSAALPFSSGIGSPGSASSCFARGVLARLWGAGSSGNSTPSRGSSLPELDSSWAGRWWRNNGNGGFFMGFLLNIHDTQSFHIVLHKPFGWTFIMFFRLDQVRMYDSLRSSYPPNPSLLILQNSLL